MRYIQSFSTSGDVQTAIDNGSLGKPYVAYVESDGVIDWNSLSPVPDYSQEYLTFEILSTGDIGFLSGGEFYYSTNDGSTWVLLPPLASLSVNAGDKILLKGIGNTAKLGPYGSALYNVSGNIMSLIYGDDFATATTLTSEYTFYELFAFSTSLISAENLVLPATTLSDGCYKYMFYGCTGLTTAPELPATTLANECYGQMFDGCTNLNYIKCLATDISATDCTTDWVNGVASTGTFVKNASMTSWTTGSNGIPSGWTVQDA